MIERGHDLSVVRQFQLLALMRRIDELHLAYPWMGSSSLQDQLVRAGRPVSRGRVRRLMRVMGINAVYRRPRTSLPAPGYTIYPYVLKGLVTDYPNQVWASDITYLPMARGFLYQVAIMDWYSRKVLAWRLSNTLTADFCVAALELALARYGAPQLFNTDLRAASSPVRPLPAHSRQLA